MWALFAVYQAICTIVGMAVTAAGIPRTRSASRMPWPPRQIPSRLFPPDQADLALTTLAEAAQTVDDVVVITRGRLAAQGPVADLAAATSTTRIRTPDIGRLIAALDREGIPARLTEADTVEVRGADPDRVARIAAAGGVTVLELSRHTDNLEELFFDLTREPTVEVSPS
jgi:hypothetical protein